MPESHHPRRAQQSQRRHQAHRIGQHLDCGTQHRGHRTKGGQGSRRGYYGTLYAAVQPAERLGSAAYHLCRLPNPGQHYVAHVRRRVLNAVLGQLQLAFRGFIALGCFFLQGVVFFPGGIRQGDIFSQLSLCPGQAQQRVHHGQIVQAQISQHACGVSAGGVYPAHTCQQLIQRRQWITPPCLGKILGADARGLCKPRQLVSTGQHRGVDSLQCPAHGRAARFRIDAQGRHGSRQPHDLRVVKPQQISRASQTLGHFRNVALRGGTTVAQPHNHAAQAVDVAQGHLHDVGILGQHGGRFLAREIGGHAQVGNCLRKGCQVAFSYAQLSGNLHDARQGRRALRDFFRHLPQALRKLRIFCFRGVHRFADACKGAFVVGGCFRCKGACRCQRRGNGHGHARAHVHHTAGKFVDALLHGQVAVTDGGELVRKKPRFLLCRRHGLLIIAGVQLQIRYDFSAVNGHGFTPFR